MLTSKESRNFMGSILNNLNESANINEAPVSFMEPQYDSRASFYKKAKVDTGDEGNENKLYSYDTLVAEMKDGKPVVYGTYSQTTLRHIKEWLKQNGFKAENSKQIMADYGVKEESVTESVKTIKLGPSSNKLTEAEYIELTQEYSISDLDDTLWSGAADRWKDMTDEQKEYLLDLANESIASGESWSLTTFNDFIWFDSDELLGEQEDEGDIEESCTPKKELEESQVSDVYEEIKGEHRQGNVSDFEVLLAGMISDIAEDMGDDYSEWLGKVDVNSIIEGAMEQDSIWRPLEDYLAEEIERKIEEIRGVPGEEFDESCKVNEETTEPTEDDSTMTESTEELKEDTQDEYGSNAIDEFNGYSLYKSSQAADVDGQSFGKYLVKDSNGNGVRSFISQNDMKAKTTFRNQ